MLDSFGSGNKESAGLIGPNTPSVFAYVTENANTPDCDEDEGVGESEDDDDRAEPPADLDW